MKLKFESDAATECVFPINVNFFVVLIVLHSIIHCTHLHGLQIKFIQKKIYIVFSIALYKYITLDYLLS